MSWLKVSTSRSDKPRRSRSALSRFPHSGFHDEAHIRRPIPKESRDVNPNTPFFNNFLNCFLKTGQTGSSSGRHSDHRLSSPFTALTLHVVVVLRRIQASGRRTGQLEDIYCDCEPPLLIPR